ncbi:DUF3862 domain-containing protein [Chitinibacter sp. S2-10]|uniref:DUF3862 domain-containing protein n=1 Tax=Chitinibacter sp. S2-10 TaxID=3373597 RepID=UPI0039774F71
MGYRIQKWGQGLCLTLLAFALIACSKITAENYQKIETGMSRAQVVEILGEPTQTQTSNLVGIASEQAVWESGKVKITATLVNDTVLIRNMSQQ